MFDSARVRGGLRCYDAIDRVVEWVITFLVKSSLRVKAEQSQNRQRFCSFVLFSLPVPVQIRIYQPIFVEKKFAELNQTALSVGDFFLVPSGRLVLEDAINFRFFLGSFFKKGSERCVLSDFFTQNYSSPVHWWWNSMYPRVSMLMNTAELCAVFIVRRGLTWSTSTSLLVFSWDSSAPSKGERCVLLQRSFFSCPVTVFSNVSTGVQAHKHRSFLCPFSTCKTPSTSCSLPWFWPGRSKATPNACLVRQIRSWGSTNTV